MGLLQKDNLGFSGIEFSRSNLWLREEIYMRSREFMGSACGKNIYFIIRRKGNIYIYT